MSNRYNDEVLNLWELNCEILRFIHNKCDSDSIFRLRLYEYLQKRGFEGHLRPGYFDDLESWFFYLEAHVCIEAQKRFNELIDQKMNEGEYDKV